MVEEIVGMANTKGGTLYLGVEDDEEIAGVHREHKDINGLRALIANITVLSLSVRADFSAQILTGTTKEDLNPNERNRLEKIIELRHGDSTLLDLDDDELDKTLQFVKSENGVLDSTIIRMLLIRKEEKITELMATAKITFQVLEGTSIRKNKEFSKSLLGAFEIIEENFNVWNPETEI